MDDDTCARFVLGEFSAPHRAPDAERPPGLLAGRYEIGRLIGSGGTARVYRAYDVRLAREVAVKLYDRDAVALDQRRRLREMSIQAGITHPGVVALLDSGTDNGRTYLVTQLVEGENLAERLQGGPLPAAEVTALADGLAEALAHVHGLRIVHRDLKPANVFLSADGPLIGDFGIAHALDTTHITGTGVVPGTAAYLAPEQVSGERAGPPADVYALGLILLECVTGRREYVGTMVEAAMARLTRPPRIPAGLPASLAHTLTRMTQRDPADRPTAAEVRRLLHAPVADRAAPRLRIFGAARFGVAGHRGSGAAGYRLFGGRRGSGATGHRLFAAARSRLFGAAQHRGFSAAQDRPSGAAEHHPSSATEHRPFGAAHHRPSSATEHRPFGTAHHRPSSATEHRPFSAALHRLFAAGRTRLFGAAGHRGFSASRHRPSRAAAHRLFSAAGHPWFTAAWHRLLTAARHRRVNAARPHPSSATEHRLLEASKHRRVGGDPGSVGAVGPAGADRAHPADAASAGPRHRQLGAAPRPARRRRFTAAAGLTAAAVATVCAMLLSAEEPGGGVPAPAPGAPAATATPTPSLPDEGGAGAQPGVTESADLEPAAVTHESPTPTANPGNPHRTQNHGKGNGNGRNGSGPPSPKN